MRPDVEEFEELNEAEGAPRSRAMSWLVLAVAVSGFVALAYYAYHSGNKAGADGEMMVVEADESPIKQLPEEAGGEQFPNKDKTIYDAIAPGAERQVEKLLPDPETPMASALSSAIAPDDSDVDGAAPQAAMVAAAPTAAPATTTYVNKNTGEAKPAADPVDTQALKQPAPAKAPETLAATPVPVVKAAPPASAPSAAEPNFVNEKVAASAKPVAAKDEKPAPAKAAAPKQAVGSGAYKVQLGAFKSEEEALGQWKKITAKFPGLVVGAPTVVKAELPNGTFYRLRASGYASADAAKAACTAMSAKGQACFPAGK